MRVSAGLLVLAACTGSAGYVSARPPLEREVVNPSEVVFRSGAPYIDLGRGRLEPLQLRRHNGEPVYYRLVRYDAESGYVNEPDTEPVVPAPAAMSARRAAPAPAPTAVHVIESRIEGRFEGWSGASVFHLGNGQTWEQVDGRRQAANRYSPKVTLTRWDTGYEYEMQVEGVSGTVRVRRR